MEIEIIFNYGTVVMDMQRTNKYLKNRRIQLFQTVLLL